jgi:hypothetical protein
MWLCHGRPPLPFALRTDNAIRAPTLIFGKDFGAAVTSPFWRSAQHRSGFAINLLRQFASDSLGVNSWRAILALDAPDFPAYHIAP